MDLKKSNKIREIVRLQQILKKWKKLANASKTNNNNNANNHHHVSSSTTSSNCDSSSSTTNTSSKSMKFLKKTLSFTESSLSSNVDVVVPKGCLAVCVGKEQKRFVIPMEYLGHQAFGILLREAEEEFGFQQQGVLKIPCEVAVFEKILKMMEHKTRDDDDHVLLLHELGFGASSLPDQTDNMSIACYSSPSRPHAQTCR